MYVFCLRIRVTSVTKVEDWQAEKAKQARNIYAIVCVSRRENSHYLLSTSFDGGFLHRLMAGLLNKI